MHSHWSKFKQDANQAGAAGLIGLWRQDSVISSNGTAVQSDVNLLAAWAGFDGREGRLDFLGQQINWNWWALAGSQIGRPSGTYNGGYGPLVSVSARRLNVYGHGSLGSALGNAEPFGFKSISGDAAVFVDGGDPSVWY